MSDFDEDVPTAEDAVNPVKVYRPVGEAHTWDFETLPILENDLGIHRRMLWDAVLETGAKRIVETGTNLGNGTRTLATAALKTGGHVWTIDKRKPRYGWDRYWPVPNLTFHRQDVMEIRDWPMELDVLFLDSHDEGTDILSHVGHEFDVFGPRVRPGGRILVHDISHRVFGARLKAVIDLWIAAHHATVVYHEGNGMGGDSPNYGMAEIVV